MIRLPDRVRQLKRGGEILWNILFSCRSRCTIWNRSFSLRWLNWMLNYLIQHLIKHLNPITYNYFFKTYKTWKKKQKFMMCYLFVDMLCCNIVYLCCHCSEVSWNTECFCENFTNPPALKPVRFLQTCGQFLLVTVYFSLSHIVPLSQ